ncbi:hypothetical protein [Pseudanabaena sp. PCC 6802]|uniref:hypothetical protein n=1 Tax=Pseudanabaena sp. PCC 6802 TaxID=118173 RepID=UPI0003484D8F|nr:hypothetical protein [Pseudanabaena sp. PCC 6802]
MLFARAINQLDNLLGECNSILVIAIDRSVYGYIFPQNLKFHTGDLSEEQQAEDRKQLEFIDFLRSRCKTVEVYFAEKYDAPRELNEKFESFPLILAETEDGEWIGITPEVDNEVCLYRLQEKGVNKPGFGITNIPVP